MQASRTAQLNSNPLWSYKAGVHGGSKGVKPDGLSKAIAANDTRSIDRWISRFTEIRKHVIQWLVEWDLEYIKEIHESALCANAQCEGWELYWLLNRMDYCQEVIIDRVGPSCAGAWYTIVVPYFIKHKQKGEDDGSKEGVARSGPTGEAGENQKSDGSGNGSTVRAEGAAEPDFNW